MTVERPHIRRAREARRGPDYAPFIDYVANLREENEPFAVLRGENADIVDDRTIEEINNELDLETVEFEGVMKKDDYVLVVSPFKLCPLEDVELRLRRWIERRNLNLVMAKERVAGVERDQ